MDRGPPALSSVQYGGHKNVTCGDAADNGETPVIGEITVITTFSSGEDENRQVMMIMKRIMVELESIAVSISKVNLV